VERDLGGNFKLKGGVIIPRKSLHELRRLLDEAPDAERALGFAENSALAACSIARCVMKSYLRGSTGVRPAAFMAFPPPAPRHGERTCDQPPATELRAARSSLTGEALIREPALVALSKLFGTLVRFLAGQNAAGSVPSGFSFALPEPCWSGPGRARRLDPGRIRSIGFPIRRLRTRLERSSRESRSPDARPGRES